MKPENLRKILMLASVEELDENAIVIPREERREASRAAGAPLPPHPGRAREERFLAKRAEDLLAKVATRFPSAGWLDPAKPPHPFWNPLWPLLLLLLAAIIGFFSNELGPEQRINILSIHLVGILAWNFLIYLREAILLFRKRSSGLIEGWFTKWQDGAAPAEVHADPEPALLERARQAFQKRWVNRSTPVYYARIKSWLHLAAIVLAASAIGGMYVRGLAREYTAVWESTFITEAEQLLPILKVILGPAVTLAGDSLPAPAELEALRGADASGENAARWIHWYALTIALFVLLPRATLSLFWRLKSRRLSAEFPYRETAPRYYSRLLATSSGTSRSLSILPYAITPDEGARAKLVRRLEDEVGAAVEANWLPAVSFGEEDAVPMETIREMPDDSELVPLFSFAATPERETHLEFYQTLSGLAPNPLRFLLLEAESFDRKGRDFADAADRRAGRLEAWRQLFAGQTVSILLNPETPAAV